MSNKEFNRNVCFTFFEDYRKTAKEIEEDFGKEAVADFYNAIIDYALYEIEPELKGVLKYTWHTIKTTIDKNVEKRSSGFRENTEQTEKILKYKEENPKATQREIAEATGVSLGKVNKVLKASSITSSITNTITNTSSSSSSNTIREHEHEHEEKKEEKREKERDLEDLTDEELNNLLRKFRGRESYANLKKEFHLANGVLDKELSSKIESILAQRAAKAKNREAMTTIKSELQTNPKLIDDIANLLSLSREEVKTIIPTLSVSLEAVYNHFKNDDIDWKAYYENLENETYVGNKTYLEFIQSIIKTNIRN